MKLKSDKDIKKSDRNQTSVFQMAANVYQNPEKMAKDAYENLINANKIDNNHFSITGNYKHAENIDFSDGVWESGFLLGEVIEKWSLIMTPKIAQLTSPKRIAMEKLYISTVSSDIKELLAKNEATILKRLESVTGNKTIKGITVSINIIDSTNLKKFFGEKYEKLEQLYFNIYKNGETFGLIGPKEKENLWDRHIINSAYLAKYLAPGDKIADIGTGGGFPGIILAILRTDCFFTFIESSGKRCAWLEKQIADLELKNASVKNERAENIKDLQFDKLTSRAVAPLKKLIPQTAHLLKKGGLMLALKGQKIREEIGDAQKEFHDFGLTRLTVLELKPNDISLDKNIDFSYFSDATVFLCIRH